ncbi:MAG: alpha/beta fold hydrolase, partial [Pyrinomonadaceae bacterium]
MAARWWAGAQASERSVVLFPGLAAPQEYFRFFAAFLAKNGWGVLTFDYRSVGASKNSSSDLTATLDDWALLDIPAAVSEVKRRTGTQFLAVFAHSIGGQLLGLSPARQEIDAALL